MEKSNSRGIPRASWADICVYRSESFCNKARDAFVEAGLIDGSRPLLLHATLVNTIYVSGRDRTRGQGNKRLVFDARNLVVSLLS